MWFEDEDRQYPLPWWAALLIALVLLMVFCSARAADCSASGTPNAFGAPYSVTGETYAQVCTSQSAYWQGYYGVPWSCSDEAGGVLKITGTAHLSGWYLEFAFDGAGCEVPGEEPPDDSGELVTVADVTETFWLMLTIWLGTAGVLYMRKAL